MAGSRPAATPTPTSWATGARGRSSSWPGATSGSTRWRRHAGRRRVRWSGTRPTPPPWVVLGEVALREGREDDAVAPLRAGPRARTRRRVRLRQADRGPGPAAGPRGPRARGRGPAPEPRPGQPPPVGVLARLRSEGGDDRQAAETWGARRKLHGDPYARKMEAYALRKAGRPGAGGRPVPGLPARGPRGPDPVPHLRPPPAQAGRARRPAFDPGGAGARWPAVAGGRSSASCASWARP